MATVDIFNSNIFATTSLTKASDKMGFVPGFLSAIPGLIMPVPVRTTSVFVEERSNGPAVIAVDNRGDPVAKRGGETRTARGYSTVRLAQSRRINSETLQNIRQFGSETELQQVMTEIARLQLLMKNDMALTKENMALGLVQGLALDGSTTLIDWGSAFGVAVPTELDFDLDNASPASGAVRKQCNVVTRSILRGLKGQGGTGVTIMAITGDNFWDDLTAHSEVRQTYLNTMEAQQLRQGNAFETFAYGGIIWTNYRGTDDGSTVAVGTDKAKFFPVGAGIFQMAYAPAETLDYVNTLGLPDYTFIEPDPAVNKKWVDVEMYSYPLPVCTMPGALHQGRRT
jgi:hypothetical protein